MKILKQLSKFFVIFFLFSFFTNTSISNEPVDIWNIEKKENTIEEKLIKSKKGINNETFQEIKNEDQNKKNRETGKV